LVYRSVADPRIGVPGVLEGLVGRARMRNEQAGISGLLLLSGRRFLQVLEGPVRFVNELLGRIIADDRHAEFELISYEPIGTPSFHDWSMAVLVVRDLPAPWRELLEGKYGLEDGAVRVPDDRLEALALLLDARWICENERKRRRAESGGPG
jgi:hypothetical protein